MDSYYSLSDIRSALGGDGNGWGGGSLLLVVVLFLFFIGFGRGWGGGNNSDYGQYATAASQQQILFNQQFDAINQRLANLGNGVCNLGYETKANIDQLGREAALGRAELAQQVSQCCCEQLRGMDAINANIDAKFAALEKAGLERTIAEQAARINRLELNGALYGVVRYPNGYTYSAGASPFCGGMSSCA